MSEQTCNVSDSSESQLGVGVAVTDLLDCVFSNVDSTGNFDEEVDVIVAPEGLLAIDPQFCPRSVHLDDNPEIIVSSSRHIGKEKPLRKSLGDTRIDEVEENDGEESVDGFCNVSGDVLSDSCPLYFQTDDLIGHASDDSLDNTDEHLQLMNTKTNSFVGDCMDEAIVRLKREILSDETDEEEHDDSADLDNQPILSSPILDQLTTPKTISDQERQNIVATLIQRAERKAKESKGRVEQSTKDKDKNATQLHETRENITDTSENQSPIDTSGDLTECDTEDDDACLQLSNVSKQMDEDTENYLDEGASHIRDSLLGVLEALKYVFQANQIETTETRKESLTSQTTDSEISMSRDQSTQTSGRIGVVGDERVDLDLLIAGLEEEFQRCLWIHQKLTEDAHQLGFDQGLQNALFLQDLVEQSVHVIWSLREERKQLEKYIKDKERDWQAMSRGLTQQVLDLRRENVQLIAAVANKEGRGGRRIKTHHLKTLLKSKHDLEKAFSLNVEKQDKINELKLLVLQQQKCIRSLQERAMEHQAASLILQHEQRTLKEGTTQQVERTEGSPKREELRPNSNTNKHNDIDNRDITRNDSCNTEKPSNSKSDPDDQQTGHIKVEDMVKLRDVLYCDHGQFAPNQSSNPEIAAMRVYGIGDDDIRSVVSTPSPAFNVLDLKYSHDRDNGDEQDNFGFEMLEISKSSSSKLASGDACTPSSS